MLSLWISVGLVNPRLVHASHRGAITPRAEKVVAGASDWMTEEEEAETEAIAETVDGPATADGSNAPADAFFVDLTTLEGGGGEDESDIVVFSSYVGQRHEGGHTFLPRGKMRWAIVNRILAMKGQK